MSLKMKGYKYINNHPFYNLKCTGVAVIYGERTHECCVLIQQTLLYRQPGDQILYYVKEAELLCKDKFTGHNCDSCMSGWTGPNCSTCDVKYGPPGQCDQCLRGWAGENCSECAANFWPTGQCDKCLRGWFEENCSQCAANFGPTGQCD